MPRIGSIPAMPHKSKEKSQLHEAKAAKQRRVNNGAHSVCAESDDPEIILNFNNSLAHKF